MTRTATNLRTLWKEIQTRLDARLPTWRERIDGMGQLTAVERRLAGENWNDDEVFEALVMAVLSAHTDWSKIEQIQGDLGHLFRGFSLKWYAGLTDAQIGKRFPSWFRDRRAGSMALDVNLVGLAGAARILLDHGKSHGTAESYFTSLVHDCGADPILAALRLGTAGTYKLPTLGVPLAAEALKNLGFDVAKPDRHVMRAIGSFGLVDFKSRSKTQKEKNVRAAPNPTAKRQLSAMRAVRELAEATDKRVVFVDNAIWLLCAKSGLNLTNTELADIPDGSAFPDARPGDLNGLIESWMGDEDAEDQRETIEHLVRALDENRLSDRKLFPKELKGKSW